MDQIRSSIKEEHDFKKHKRKVKEVDSPEQFQGVKRFKTAKNLRQGFSFGKKVRTSKEALKGF